jgi:hypothetical protein
VLDSKSNYERYLLQLPKTVPIERFDVLVSFLAMLDFFLLIIAVVSLLLMFAALCTTLPSNALRWGACSRKFLWSGWLIGFLPPFLAALIFPFRTLVDWDGVLHDVCAQSIRSTFAMPGSSLPMQLEALAQEQLLDPSLHNLHKNIPGFCADKGETWHEAFYGAATQCLWQGDQICRDRICVGDNPLIPLAGQDLTTCLQNCIQYAFSQSSSPEAFRATYMSVLTPCLEAGGPPPASIKLTPPPMSKDVGPADVASLYDFTARLQQAVVQETSASGTVLSMQAEYVVGMLIGTVFGKHMLPAAFSLLGGLTEALTNVKAVFPGSQASGWVIILTTWEAVPMAAALLAICNQMIGDVLLSIAGLLAVFFLSLGMLTGKRFLRTASGERQKVYGLVWGEYILRAVLAGGIAACMITWVLSHDKWGIKEYIRDDILTVEVIVLMIIDCKAKQILTATAGTDAATSAFVQSEIWRETMTEEDLKKHTSVLNDMDRLFSAKRGAGAGSAEQLDSSNATG